VHARANVCVGVLMCVLFVVMCVHSTAVRHNVCVCVCVCVCALMCVCI